MTVVHEAYALFALPPDTDPTEVTGRALEAAVAKSNPGWSVGGHRTGDDIVDDHAAVEVHLHRRNGEVVEGPAAYAECRRIAARGAEDAVALGLPVVYVHVGYHVDFEVEHHDLGEPRRTQLYQGPDAVGWARHPIA